MDGTTYRKLTEAEIATLEANGCSAFDWAHIEVVEAFVPNQIRRCRFSGTIRIGKNVTIDGIHESIENYEIGDNVVIINTESLVSTYKSTFGNGVKVAALNESGGREVPIYNGLTAQIAYLMAMYRHRPEAVKAIEKLIDTEIKNNTPELGQIGTGTYIAHCGALTDICTGENAVLRGVAELTNGTVNSTADSPTTIGRGVIARDFIVADGAEITDFAYLSNCFVGQGTRIGKGFTAQSSLFFANCECEQGEACAVFAGPYTVTHHKSTLLIGGMFSFYNAGSNTNQSNHMYRLGPVHQGVLERGCKTGSGSYILFPAHIGPYTVVTGRHYGNPDTSLLPFSYLVEENGKSIVLPGENLKSIGLARDVRKWPQRDRRKGLKHDHIVFDLLNPYTVGKIYRALEVLDDPLSHRKLAIPRIGLNNTREAYLAALEVFKANVIMKRIKSGKSLTNTRKVSTDWLDLAGLIAPKVEVERILEMATSMHSIHELTVALTGLYEHYDEWEWDYLISLLDSKNRSPEDWAGLISTGISASETFLQWQTTSAAKEYTDKMRAGYGLGDDQTGRDVEFASIHGTVETNTFLRVLRQDFQLKQEEMKKWLKAFRTGIKT